MSTDAQRGNVYQTNTMQLIDNAANPVQPEKPIQDEKGDINTPIVTEKKGGEPTAQDQQTPETKKETGGGACEACTSCFQLIGACVLMCISCAN